MCKLETKLILGYYYNIQYKNYNIMLIILNNLGTRRDNSDPAQPAAYCHTSLLPWFPTTPPHPSLYTIYSTQTVELTPSICSLLCIAIIVDLKFNS